MQESVLGVSIFLALAIAVTVPYALCRNYKVIAYPGFPPPRTRKFWTLAGAMRWRESYRPYAKTQLYRRRDGVWIELT